MDKNLNRKILYDKKGEKKAPEEPSKPLVFRKKEPSAKLDTKVVETKVVFKPKAPKKFQGDKAAQFMMDEVGKMGTPEPNKALKIVAWVNNHPEFKWAAMCRKIGLDKGNFQRVLKSKKPVIKAALIPKIEEILKKYGYAE